MGSEGSGIGNGRSGLSPNIAGLLAYMLLIFTGGLPVGGVILLVIEKEDQAVRFHAWQSIVLGVSIWGGAILMSMSAALAGAIGAPLKMIIMFGKNIWLLGGIVVWVLCMVRTYRGEIWSIPVLGELAERLRSHQEKRSS